MTIGDCSCYWDIKQTYFVWSLSAQILYSFIWVRPLQKKENKIQHLGALFKPWNPSYRIMTQVRLTERIGVSSSSISVGWQTIQSSCHLPTRQYNRANIALLTSTIDTLPERKKDRGYEDMRENKVFSKLPGHKQHFQGQEIHRKNWTNPCNNFKKSVYTYFDKPLKQIWQIHVTT